MLYTREEPRKPGGAKPGGGAGERRQTNRPAETHRHREKKTETDRDTQRHRQRSTDRNRYTQRQTDRHRQKCRDIQRFTHRGRQTDRGDSEESLPAPGSHPCPTSPGSSYLEVLGVSLHPLHAVKIYLLFFFSQLKLVFLLKPKSLNSTGHQQSCVLTQLPVSPSYAPGTSPGSSDFDPDLSPLRWAEGPTSGSRLRPSRPPLSWPLFTCGL